MLAGTRWAADAARAAGVLGAAPLAALYTESGDWARAVRCTDRILRLTPDNAEAHFFLADLSERQ